MFNKSVEKGLGLFYKAISYMDDVIKSNSEAVDKYTIQINDLISKENTARDEMNKASIIKKKLEDLVKI